MACTVTLPQDIVDVILSFSTITKCLLCDLALVSKQFYLASKSDTYWENIWVNRFPDSIHIIKNNFRYACIEINKHKHENPQIQKKTPPFSTVEDIRLVIFGSPGCGKTMLIHQYCNIREDYFDPTM